MKNRYEPVLNRLKMLEPEMVLWTKDWVAINSGSYNREGLLKMADVLQSAFGPLGDSVERITLAPLSRVNSKGDVVDVPLGEALRIRKRADAPIQVFFGGHMDTVFGKDSPFQSVHEIKPGVLNGPGVADLKGGLAVLRASLMAFEESEFAEMIGWEVLINPDEEIGSIGSDSLLKEAAARCDFGLIYEPALTDGTLAGARKGSGNFTVVARGRAAHAGRDHHLGRNAIAGLAEFIRMINSINGKQAGVTVNPGIIEGGVALNTVPDMALCRFNIRVQNNDEQLWVEAQLETIIETLQAQLDGITFEVHGNFTRPPKLLTDDNTALFELVADSATKLGQTIGWRATGGCCDGNNLAAYGLPNVDTMGVRGGELHSEREFMHVESLLERAQLTTLLLMRIASGEAHFLRKRKLN